MVACTPQGLSDLRLDMQGHECCELDPIPSEPITRPCVAVNGIADVDPEHIARLEVWSIRLGGLGGACTF